jgi:hypothetical protein
MEEQSGECMYFLIEGHAAVVLHADDDEDGMFGPLTNPGQILPGQAHGGTDGTKKPPEEILRVLEVGDYFGEIAMILGVKRTASVRARDVCRTFVLSKSDLTFLSSYYPEISVGVGKFIEHTTHQFETYHYKAKPAMEDRIQCFNDTKKAYGITSAVSVLGKLKHGATQRKLLGAKNVRTKADSSDYDNSDRLASSPPVIPLQVFQLHGNTGPQQRCESAFEEMGQDAQEEVLKKLVASRPDLLAKLGPGTT